MIQNFSLIRKWRSTTLVSLFTLFCSLLVFDAMSQQTWEYDFTGSVQAFNSASSGKYLIETWGAEGGKGWINGNPNSSSDLPGKGGYTSGEVTLNGGDQLFIYVGGQGGSNPQFSAGGWNGGGSSDDNDGDNDDSGGGGGGASDLRLNGQNMADRIIVAGGGGGTGCLSGAGGSAGGFDAPLIPSNCGIPGSQTGGYQLGVGGSATSTVMGGVPGGGGGGYYGGGICTASYTNGGLGGSGYVDEAMTDALSISGNQSIPNPAGVGTIIGKSGNGFVRITQLYNVNLYDHTDATCAETADGSLSVVISGGTPPYTFEWSSGVTTTSGAAISGYTLLGNRGEHSYYRSINQVATYDEAQVFADSQFGNLVSINTAGENAWLLANGVQAGDNIGGTDREQEGTWKWASGEPFSYTNWRAGEPNNGGGSGQSFMQMYGDGAWDDVQWANGSAERHIMELPGISILSDLTPGEYTVTVTDVNGNETSGTYSVGPDPIQISFDMTPTSSCDEINDGSLEAQVSGGTAPYSYLWSSGETTATITDKSIGSYTVTVTDANNCASVVGTYSIAPDDNTAPVAISKNIEVYLDENGAASIQVEDINDGSYDDCSLGELSVDRTEFSCEDIFGGPATFDGNTAISFDGVDDHMDFDQLIPYSSTHTISVWLKLGAQSSGVIFSWGSPVVNNGSRLQIWASRLRYTATSGAGSTTNVTGNTLLNDDEWHYVVATRNGNEVTTYVDGILEATGTIAVQVSNPTVTSLGGGLINGIYQGQLAAQMDDFAYWPQVLGAEQIESLACTGPQGAEVFLDFESGAGTTAVSDQSGNGHSATLVNMDTNAAWTAFGEPVETPQCAATGKKVVLTVNDNAGNWATADAYVTVRDTIAPVAISKAFTVELGSNGTGALSADDVNNGSNDNCGIDQMSVDKTSFDCENLGQNQAILTSADISGNATDASAQIEVVDLLDPSLEVQNIEVSLDANGTAAITTDLVEVSSADNCGIVSKSLSLSEFSCDDLNQAVEVEMTVTDASGNQHSETFTVTVKDETAPVAHPNAYTIALDENGLAEFDQEMIAEFMGGDDTDDCSGIDSESSYLNQMQFSCDDLGENEVTYSISDLSGNTDSAPVTVTVIDTLAPSAIAQDIVAELNEEGVAVISADDADNGSSDNCSIASRELSTTEFSCADLGEQEVTLSVKDASGNESQAVLTVNVVDNVAPVIAEELSMTIYLDENGEGILDTAPLLAEASDNCGLDAIVVSVNLEDYTDINGFPFSCEDVGMTQGPLFVRDNSGNITPFTLQLSILDTIKPSFDLDVIHLEIDDEGNAYLTQEMLLPYASDNCSIAEVAIQHAAYNCSQIGALQYTEILVYDNHGNATQQTLEVQLTDKMKPEVQVENITIALNANGQVVLNTDLLEVMVQDNCDATDFSFSQTEFSCDDLGSNAVSITVTDASGNTGAAEFMVTVVDDLAPEISAPQTIELCQGIPVRYDEIVATDNCSVELSVMDGPQAGDTPEVGEYMVEFEAVDASGNATSAFVMLYMSPTPEVDLGEDMEVEAGAIITLVAGANNGNDYVWSNGSTGSVYQYVATEDGTVSVEVTTPNGCSATDTINITISNPLGIAEDATGNSVRFYPNPTRGQVSIALSLTEVAKDIRMNIMDISGKSVYQRVIPTAKDGDVISLDLSSFAKGIYLVNLQSDSINITKRVVKQ